MESSNVLRSPAPAGLGSRRKRNKQRNIDRPLSQPEKESSDPDKPLDGEVEIEVGGDPITAVPAVCEACHEVLHPVEEAGKHQCRDRDDEAGTITKSGGKQRRCGICSGCTSKLEDCGNCVFCLDKPKFGGSGIRRKACIRKKCKNVGKSRVKTGNLKPAVLSVLQPNEEESLSVSVNNLSPEVEILEVALPKSNVRCGTCAGCCQSDNCGKCKFCKDKPKFGGKDKRKKACIKKRCLKLADDDISVISEVDPNPVKNQSPKDLVGGKKKTKQSVTLTIERQLQKRRVCREKIVDISKCQTPRARKKALKEKWDQHSCPLHPCMRQCRTSKELRLHVLTSHFLEETNKEFSQGKPSHSEFSMRMT